MLSLRGILPNSRFRDALCDLFPLVLLSGHPQIEGMQVTVRGSCAGGLRQNETKSHCPALYF
ncbi:hypothetical protein PM02_08065 [Sulfitobacter mediterraneus]|uniref:Uncharacterized protein n=1 Tax=Sulfitobacter mediterraneus TaxID=83219 RepID=A0A061SW45_9RHOB|nr:hypothetical protein PM02_08065 [Sulfitobacter mediterraneus]